MTTTVYALAGRRVDAADAPVPRFPLAQVEAVRSRLRSLFSERPAGTLVSAAACGADLVALEVAAERGMRRRIVLPSTVDEFRRGSVTDRPGDWGPVYDRQIAEAGPRGDLANLSIKVEGNAAYLLANEAILDQAQALAGPEGTVVAVLVWDGKPRGDDDVTFQFGQSARKRRLEVLEIPTL